MTAAAARTRDDDEINLTQWIRIATRYWWLIGGVVVSAVLLTFIVTSRATKMYESTTTLITPRESTTGGFLSTIAATGLVQQLPGISLPSLTPNRDIIVSIVRSRTVAEAVIKKFGLQERYNERLLDDTIRALRGATTVTLSKEGVISLKVEDSEPAIAAQMANFYVQELNRLVTELGSGDSSRQRVFIGEQMKLARKSLEEAEDGLRRFQEKNRAIVLQDQTRGALEAAARLKGEMIAAEVQLQVMRNFATESNPEVVSLRRRIDEMKRQLSQMQYGGDGSVGDGAAPRGGGARQDIYVPFARVPEVGLELARRTRDLKIQETLVTLLSQQFEQAKIAEAKDLPTVQVLDPAVPAQRHSRPSRLLNMAIAGTLSLLAGVILAVVADRTDGPGRRRTGMRPAERGARED
jgi:tyrosine-protein kinase Etk/Wzc